MKDILVGGKVTSLDLSRDETKLAVCSRDDKIQVSVPSTQPLLMTRHDNILQVLDLRGNGTVLTTVGGDGYHVGCDWSRYLDKTLNIFQMFTISP